MHLADIISIQLFSSNSNLENIIICMEIKSGNKNPYYIYFPKTDVFGKSELKKTNIIGQFEDHWEQGLMDYNGTIETANPEVTISLFDPTWMKKNKKLSLSWPLLKHEKLIWKSREEKYNYMISCANSKYISQNIIVNLELTNNISYEIVARK